jgi:mannosyl-oligosaccharide alpha-1,2-mannosidase
LGVGRRRFSAPELAHVISKTNFSSLHCSVAPYAETTLLLDVAFDGPSLKTMLTKRLLPVYIVTGIALTVFFCSSRIQETKPTLIFNRPPPKDGHFEWNARIEKYPVTSLIPLPTGTPVKIPSIQHKITDDSAVVAEKWEQRRQSVKKTFTRAWTGYKEHAWMKDELTPISGSSRSHFGGWAATLVDSLDTLWIMDLKTEFAEALESVENIDFTTSEEDEINTFETTIRYLGGLLAAFDLSDGKYPVLLQKALELGDMLYAAFDTPNRIPITRWKWKT